MLLLLPILVTAEPAFLQQSCGPDRWCFLDSGGKLHHWVKRYDLELPPYTDFWGNYKYDKTRSEFFISGGFAELSARQEDYNQWVRMRRIPDAVPIKSDGSLNKRTLKIPAYRMAGALKLLWSQFQDDCRDAAERMGMRFGRCGFSIEGNEELEARWSKDPPLDFHPAGPQDDQCVTIRVDGKLLGDCFYPNRTIHARAMAMQRAWSAIRRFEGQVDGLKPFTPCGNCSGPWKTEIDPDHLEPESLSKELLSKIVAAQKEAQAALDEARASEEAAQR